MRTIAIIQARLGSRRLPGKSLTDLGGTPVLGWVVAAARRVSGLDGVAVATSDAAADDPIAAYCAELGVACHRGAEQDVLDRFAQAARAERADLVMRLTADCPLLDPAVCEQVLMLQRRTGAAYASNADPHTWPDGLDCEVFTAEALFAAAAEARRPSDREHVTPFLRDHRLRFPARNLVCPLPGLKSERWTLDRAEDLAFLRAVVARLPPGRPHTYCDVLLVLEAEPELRRLNAAIDPEEGRIASLRAEALDLDRVYTRSDALFPRAEAVIPLGSQTFSKSRMQFPEAAAPLFLTHGQGGRCWDVDGNEYVDLMGGLLPLVLGYRDPDVDDAIRAQLSAGISFSLPSLLETELAERLVRLIPCAEKVRFGKNGSDATSAAIRLARAHTGRDRVACCGYHGWQDWYIGATTRSKGVPPAARALTQLFPYNDLAALERLLGQHPGEFAAVMLEPMNVADPAPGYLEGVRDLAHAHGALLVFDEVITGFRFHLGGAQSLFGVVPDLASFGKAMGNGMPISAVVGRAEVMAQMEEIFFSGTFGGEALSLAAAIAVIDKMEREPVIERLWRTGERLAALARGRIAAHGLDGTIALVGKAPWTLITFKESAGTPVPVIRTLFLREMLRAGVLTLGSHNVCYAHDEADIARVEAAYDHACGEVAAALRQGDALARIGGKAIEPVFKVR